MDDESTTRQDRAAAAAVAGRMFACIVEAIERADGWIPFSRFMDLALYAPGLGYYTAGAPKIGRGPQDGSDFVTAPELTPLFARALARPVAAILAAGGDTILELGGGTGRLAAGLLVALEELDRLPARYLMLDVSSELRERQQATVTREAPGLVDRMTWIDALPDRIHGAVVGNEVLDALPVDLVVFDGNRWQLRGVVVDGDVLGYADRPLPAALAPAIAQAGLLDRPFPHGYQTELHSAAAGLVASVTDRMTSVSTALWIDYGFPRSEYFHPQRSTGTLMAHRRHRASMDLLADPGAQDLTAHVDFSAVARAARSAGGCVIGYASQAAFLIDCGIADLLAGQPGDAASWAPQVAALNVLLSEAEMGELFKVIGIARQDFRLPGFRGRDRSASLDE